MSTSTVMVADEDRILAMPLPRSVARFNRALTNHVTRPIAGHLPGFGVVIHVGRTTGRRYRTPVNVFARPGGWKFALTYGEADWVRNALEAGGGWLESRGRVARFVDPVLVEDAGLRDFPPAVRWILRRIDVNQVLPVDEA